MEERIELTFEQLGRIWDLQQRQKAKSSLYAVDRKKQSLTYFEKLNRWCQIGNFVKYKEVSFTFESGFGCLDMGNNRGVIGATLGMFMTYIKNKYGATPEDIEIVTTL